MIGYYYQIDRSERKESSMNWFTKMMYGRYGTDQLGFVTQFLALILNIVYTFTRWNVLYMISTVLMVLCIWRIFSRNISRRYAENQKYLQMTAPMRTSVTRWLAQTRDLKTHRHYRCPECRQKIRVPKGKGKIQITCPKCRHEFVKKT